jgi:hypothetical protein
MYVNKAGYVTVWNPTHPMAGANGKVLQHRQVLYDAMGYGPHLCYVCNASINWRAGLEVDHFDKNRENNHIDNLGPICVPCNRARRKWKPADEWHKGNNVVPKLERLNPCPMCPDGELGERQTYCSQKCIQKAYRRRLAAA